jgi:predicted phage terminase large subunit-like protein
MGRRFGKTALMVEVILNCKGGALAGVNGYGRQGLPCAWYAPNDAYFTRVFQDIVQQYGAIIIKATSQPRPVIHFRNGGRIDFWTLENPMKCGRGNHYARVVIDEAAHARHLQDAWEKTIIWTLADLNGDAWFISTPNGLNYFSDLYRKADSDPDWVSHTAPSFENPYLPDGWMEEQRETMPSLVFAQEVLAQFVTFGAGLVKPDYLAEGTAPAGLPVVLGVDLAISEKQSADFTAIVAMSRDPERGLIYIREVERHRCSFHEVLSRIKAAAARWNPVLIGVEQTQYQAAVIQELSRTTKLPVRGIRPDKDKLTRFMPLLTRYEQRLVRHDPAKVPAWFVEELLSFPEGQHDDGCLVAGTIIETLRGLIPIELVCVGDMVLTRKGYKPVLASGMTNANARVVRALFSDGRSITGTGNHPVMSGNTWIELEKTANLDIVSVCYSVHLLGSICKARLSITKAFGSIARLAERFIDRAHQKGSAAWVICTRKSIKTNSALFQSTIESFISMVIPKTTLSKTLNCLRHAITPISILPTVRREVNLLCNLNTLQRFAAKQANGIGVKMVAHGTASMVQGLGKTEKHTTIPARYVARFLAPVMLALRAIALPLVIKNTSDWRARIEWLKKHALSAVVFLWRKRNRFIARVHVQSVSVIETSAAVYNLSVDGEHEYFANGVLVHNCDASAHAFRTLAMIDAKPSQMLRVPNL